MSRQGTPCSTQLIFCETQREKLEARVEKLEAALKRNIRIYRVADEAWDPDAEVERLFKLEMGE